jgi:hypothetical protein
MRIGKLVIPADTCHKNGPNQTARKNDKERPLHIKLIEGGLQP